MLKRQRPSSPGPSSVPLVSDTPGDLIAIDRDQLQHQSKRRRTVPPTLDGPSRGLPPSRNKRLSQGCGWPDHYQDEDDAEDEYYSDPEEGASTSCLDGPQVSEYKSTNNMLRELHTLHQHRLLFSGPPNQYGFNNNNDNNNNEFLIPNPNMTPLSSHLSQVSRAYSDFQNPNSPLTKGGMILPDKSRIPLSAPPQQHQQEGPQPCISSSSSPSFLDKGSISTSSYSHSTPHQVQQQHQLQHKLSEETTRVSERYESTNRMIGSWFLQRRRALDSMDEGSALALDS